MMAVTMENMTAASTVQLKVVLMVASTVVKTAAQMVLMKVEKMAA